MSITHKEQYENDYIKAQANLTIKDISVNDAANIIAKADLSTTSGTLGAIAGLSAFIPGVGIFIAPILGFVSGLFKGKPKPSPVIQGINQILHDVNQGFTDVKSQIERTRTDILKSINEIEEGRQFLGAVAGQFAEKIYTDYIEAVNIIQADTDKQINNIRESAFTESNNILSEGIAEIEVSADIERNNIINMLKPGLDSKLLDMEKKINYYKELKEFNYFLEKEANMDQIARDVLTAYNVEF